MKIAVIGLGIAGLSIATRLAQAGHDVDGYEQFDLMHAHGSSHGDTRIIRFTPGEGDAYVDLAARAAPLWNAWSAASSAALINWTGGLMAGPPGSAFVASCAALSARYGHPFQAMSPAAVAAETAGGLHFAEDWEIVRQSDCGVVYADRVRAFLIPHAQAAGARLHAHTAMTPAKALATHDRVILAQGAWNAPLMPNSLRAERRVLAWFEAGRDLPVICVDDEAGVYGMPTPDGLYKIGLHAVGELVDPMQVRDPDDADAALLSAYAARYLRLEAARPVQMARCLYTLTPDSNFLITPAPFDARALVFSACSGHGFKFAPAFGELALDWIEGRALAAAFAGAGAAFTPLGG
ncbi:MAG: FAD-dependent oxidoreductase [Pseudomonadota bacterium]